MINEPLLISYQALTECSELNSNIDPNILRPLIVEVQEMRLKEVLGTRLFNKILADIQAGTLTSVYLTLTNTLVRKAMIYSVLTDLPFKSAFRFTNTGIVSRTSENSENPEEKTVQNISNYYKGRREFYLRELSQHLCVNYLLYPEYDTEETSDETKPKPGHFKTGIYLG